MVKNIILTTTLSPHPIDEHHWYVTIGPNCWGRGTSAAAAFKECKMNAPHGYRGLFITRVAPREGFGIDPIDGSISWSETHDAKNCPLCSVGKGIRINTDETFRDPAMKPATKNTPCLCEAGKGRGIGIVVIKGEEVYTSRRLHTGNPTQFPGGHVEIGENCDDAAVRELNEEGGLLVDKERLIPLFHSVDSVGYKGQQYLACGFAIVLKPDEKLTNPEPEKHTDWVLVHPRSLKDVNMIPSSKRALECVMKDHIHLFKP